MGVTRKSALPPRSVFPSQLWQSTTSASSTVLPESYTQSASDVATEVGNSHVRALCATTANVTLSGAQSIDGVTLANGNRVLVKNQSVATANGIYAYNPSGAWPRTADIVQAGMLVSVTKGTVNGDRLFQCANDTDPDVGTDNVSFASVGNIDGSGTANRVTKWTDSDTLEAADIFHGSGTTSFPAASVSSTGRVEVYQSSDTQSAAYCYYSGTGATKAAVEAISTGNGTSAIRASFAGTGGQAIHADGNNGIGIVATGAEGIHALPDGPGSALVANRDNAAGSSPVVSILQDHVSDTSSVVTVRGDGIGDLLYINHTGNKRFVVEDGGQTDITTTGNGFALHVFTNNTDAAKGITHLEAEGSYGANYIDTASGGHANHSPQYIFRRGRGTIASPSTVQNGDQLGGFYFRGHNGTDYQQRAGFGVFVDGAVAGTTVPANLIFYTGTTALTERMRITSAGDVGIGETTIGARLDVKASNTTATLTANQQSTGKIITAEDNGTEVFSVEDGGNTYMQKGRRVGVRTLTASPTTLTASDDIVLVNTASVTHTITLPAVSTGRILTIKDSGNNAATRNITINRGGASLIDGATSKTINTNYGVYRFACDGTNWFLI